MLLVEQFQEFLVRTGQTREDFALIMGVNASLLSRLIPSDGGPPIREPRLSTIKRLVAASGGAIRFEDFCRKGAFLARKEGEARPRVIGQSRRFTTRARRGGRFQNQERARS